VEPRGRSSMVERQLPKLHTRVRFPSPAPTLSGFCQQSFESGFEKFVRHLASSGLTVNRPAGCWDIEEAVPTTIDEYSLATVPVIQFFNDTVLGNATAFVWRHTGKDFLITNWHVVTARNNETGANLHPQGGHPNKLRLYFNSAGLMFGKHEATQELFLSDGNPLWLVHPVHGRAVDVVAIPLPAQPEHLNFRPINEMSTEALQISVGMDVFVLGYPFGFQLPGYPV
jgi:hypothetical protein